MLIRFCLLQTTIWKINQIIPNVTKVANWSLKVFPCCCSPSVASAAVEPNDSPTCSGGSDLIPGVCATNIVQRSCVAWHDCATCRTQSCQQSGQVMSYFNYCVSEQLSVKSSVAWWLPALPASVVCKLGGAVTWHLLSCPVQQKEGCDTISPSHHDRVTLEKTEGDGGGGDTGVSIWIILKRRSGTSRPGANQVNCCLQSGNVIDSRSSDLQEGL